MGDISPVLFAACGLAVVCAGLVFVAVLIAMRVARGSHGGALVGLLGRSAQNSDAEVDLMPRRQSRRMTSSDFQNKAQALDFDAALQKYRQTPGADSAPPSPSLRGRSSRPSTSGSALTPNASEREDPLDDFDGRSFNLRNTSNPSLRRSRRQHEDDNEDLMDDLLGDE